MSLTVANLTINISIAVVGTMTMIGLNTITEVLMINSLGKVTTGLLYYQVLMINSTVPWVIGGSEAARATTVLYH